MAGWQPKQDLAERDELVYAAAVRYLSRRDYSEQELRQRLQRRGASEQAVEAALLRLKESGLLSDERFAASRVRTRKEIVPRGRGYVRQELRRLGVDEQVISSALDEHYDEEQELAALEKLALRQVRQIAQIEDKELQLRKKNQLLRKLINRGFRQSMVLSVVNRLLDQEELAEQEDLDYSGQD